jgi:beta-glucosidase
MPNNILSPHTAVNAKDPSSKSTIFTGAIEGHVLVKNINNALPLRQPKLLSIYGYDAKGPNIMQPDINWALGYTPFDNTEFSSVIFSSVPKLTPQTTNSTLISGGGSGAVTPAYWNAPYDALQQRAYEDGSSLLWDFITPNSNSIIDAASDACLVFINAWASEGYDRSGSHDVFSDTLVTNIAAKCSNTIVVIHNAGIRLVDQFVTNPNVTGIIFAHLPGQDSGRAITALLYGDVNFSGKLPYTVAKNESDYGLLYEPSLPDTLFALFPQDNFTEGVFIDYRAFDKANITPRYEFGFGLSYTNFTYSNLQITKLSPGNQTPYPQSAIIPGGAADLWDAWAFVDVDVINTGSVEGMEVVQLYIGIPDVGSPVRQLRGFDKQNIAPGGTFHSRFTLTRRDLSIWDTAAQKWKLVGGDVKVFVGSSSRDIRLNGTLSLQV